MLASGVEFLVLNLEVPLPHPSHPKHLHIQPQNLFLGSMKLLPMQPVCCFSWQWPLRPSHSSAGKALPRSSFPRKAQRCSKVPSEEEVAEWQQTFVSRSP